jgi:hypothetical protein
MVTNSGFAIIDHPYFEPRIGPEANAVKMTEVQGSAKLGSAWVTSCLSPRD